MMIKTGTTLLDREGNLLVWQGGERGFERVDETYIQEPGQVRILPNGTRRVWTGWEWVAQEDTCGAI